MKNEKVLVSMKKLLEEYKKIYEKWDMELLSKDFLSKKDLRKLMEDLEYIFKNLENLKEIIEET